MLQTMILALPNAARVAEQLVGHFGFDAGMRVEQFGADLFWVELDDGRVAVARVQEGGKVSIREMEAVL